MEVEVSTWVGGLALFELAALDLTEMDALDRTKAEVKNDAGAPSEVNVQDGGRTWKDVLQRANCMLDEALGLSPDSVDLSSRLDSRISMFKEEIRRKGELVGVEIG